VDAARLADNLYPGAGNANGRKALEEISPRFSTLKPIRSR